MYQTLRHKPEIRGFDSQWYHFEFPSERTMSLGSTRPLREMSTGNISWGWLRRPVRRVETFTTFLCRLFIEILILFRPVMGCLDHYKFVGIPYCHTNVRLQSRLGVIPFACGPCRDPALKFFGGQ